MKYKKINSTSLIITVFIVLTVFSGNKIFASDSRLIYPDIKISEDELVNIVHKIASIQPPRNYKNIESLNAVAQIILNDFKESGYEAEYQKYEVNGKIYKNVIARTRSENRKTLIIGAHYDVYGSNDGADDNASGIAGLMVLAKLLKKNEHRLNKAIELVAYSLEEPLYFRTEHMGSFIHAKSLKYSSRQIFSMISIDMIGHFSDEPDSQFYPSGVMKYIYPSTADFIGIIGNLSSRRR